jgi:metallophosphoesterase (TIGR00282 family)
LSDNQQLAVLIIGDIFGDPGRRILRQHLPRLKQKLSPDLIIVNAENAAGGIGLLPRQAHEIFALGVDVITGGNHSLARSEIYSVLAQEPHLLRPVNLQAPPGQTLPGQGWVIAHTAKGRRVAVVNLLGSAFMPAPVTDSPFIAMEKLLQGPLLNESIICVDFHAEATSEKQALAWYFDGKISALAGTQTHVPTADERLLPQGTAYISDIGITGPYDSVIGLDPQTAIARFLTDKPLKFKVAKGKSIMNGVLICINERTGRAESINRLTVGPLASSDSE